MTKSSDQSDRANQCINDLLYFLNFKRKVNAVNDVVSTCETFYTQDAIIDAKRQFFDAVGEKDGMRCVNRRGENPAKSNLEDLINAMNKCDNDGVVLPLFLSSDPTKIPPNNDGNVSLNQILYLIEGLKTQVSNLEKKCASNSNSSVSPSLLPSAPPPPPLASLLALPSHSALSSHPAPLSAPFSAPIFAPLSAPLSAPSASLSDFPHLPTSSGSAQIEPSSDHRSSPSFASTAATSAAAAPHVMSNHVQSVNRSAVNGRTSAFRGKIRSAEDRVKADHVRNKNIVIGKKPSSGAMSWGGAPLTVDCYVGRVDIGVTAEQIKSDIVAMGVDVVTIEENVTRHSLFNSFKLVIRKKDFDSLNSPEVWPEGVVFRRFRRPRPPDTGHVADTLS